MTLLVYDTSGPQAEPLFSRTITVSTDASVRISSPKLYPQAFTPGGKKLLFGEAWALMDPGLFASSSASSG